jgi:DNA-binding transcriptional regulator YbjK
LTMYFQGIKALLTEKFNLRKEIQNWMFKDSIRIF